VGRAQRLESLVLLKVEGGLEPSSLIEIYTYARHHATKAIGNRQ